MVQRQTAEEEEEELIQTKIRNGSTGYAFQRQPEEEELLQTKTAAGHTPVVSQDAASDIASMQGGGQPLPASERAFFELRFGHDFSRVRVHTDTKAARTAQTMNARAFTLGRDLVFGAGQYTQTSTGRRLLAHELTHVIQQSHMKASNERIRNNSKAYELRRKENGLLYRLFNRPPELIPHASPPVQGDCGKIAWETRWELSKYSRGGFIVQEVHWNETPRRYCDREWTEPISKSYFEAWWVTPNGKFPSDNDAVPDTMGRKIPHELPRGTIEINATAWYHDNVPESALPGDMIRFNPDTNGGSLRSSTQDPGLGGNISKPVPHYFKFEWDCCGAPRRTRVIKRIP